MGVDKDTDLAVVKISTTEPLPTVKMGNSDSGQVGDWVIAIGSPFAFTQTVTAGIVSAKNRRLKKEPPASSSISSKPTRPSTRAILEDRWSIWRTRSLGSTQRS